MIRFSPSRETSSIFSGTPASSLFRHCTTWAMSSHGLPFSITWRGHIGGGGRNRVPGGRHSLGTILRGNGPRSPTSWGRCDSRLARRSCSVYSTGGTGGHSPVPKLRIRKPSPKKRRGDLAELVLEDVVFGLHALELGVEAGADHGHDLVYAPSGVLRTGRRVTVHQEPEGD